MKTDKIDLVFAALVALSRKADAQDFMENMHESRRVMYGPETWQIAQKCGLPTVTTKRALDKLTKEKKAYKIRLWEGFPCKWYSPEILPTNPWRS